MSNGAVSNYPLDVSHICHTRHRLAFPVQHIAYNGDKDGICVYMCENIYRKQNYLKKEENVHDKSKQYAKEKYATEKYIQKEKKEKERKRSH